ncbi:MAG: AAA family ATPase [Bacteroidetes bacterium]|nr:AAA family ATPase [Bacteroidota bacterium]
MDADPQANSTSGIGFDPKVNRTNIYDCMINEKIAKDAVIDTATPNFFYYLLTSIWLEQK